MTIHPNHPLNANGIAIPQKDLDFLESMKSEVTPPVFKKLRDNIYSGENRKPASVQGDGRGGGLPLDSRSSTTATVRPAVPRIQIPGPPRSSLKKSTQGSQPGGDASKSVQLDLSIPGYDNRKHTGLGLLGIPDDAAWSPTNSRRGSKSAGEGSDAISVYSWAGLEVPGTPVTPGTPNSGNSAHSEECIDYFMMVSSSQAASFKASTLTRKSSGRSKGGKGKGKA